MVPAIDANTDGDGEFPCRPLAFDEDAGELGTAAKNVIRPFQREIGAQVRRAIEDGVVERQRGDERQFRGAFSRRRIDQKQRRIEVARLGNPRISPPATARGLLPGYDPERTVLAAARQRQRFGVGGFQRFMGCQPIARRHRRGVKLHQNSEWAAALATPTNGPGKRTKSRLNSAQTPSTTLSSAGMP